MSTISIERCHQSLSYTAVLPAQRWSGQKVRSWLEMFLVTCLWVCFVTLAADPGRLSHLKQAGHVTQLLRHHSTTTRIGYSWLSTSIYIQQLTFFWISDNIFWWRSIFLRLMSDQMFLTTIVPTSWYKAGALIQVKGWWSKETALGSKSAQVQTLYQLLRSGRGNQTLIDACWSRYSLQPTTAKI